MKKDIGVSAIVHHVVQLCDKATAMLLVVRLVLVLQSQPDSNDSVVAVMAAALPFVARASSITAVI